MMSGSMICNPIGEHRVERGHRLLEDHRDVAAAVLAHLVFGQREKIAALEQHAAAGHPARRLREKAHHRERGHGFPAAGLADQGHHFARIDAPAHPLDRTNDATRR
jgi:hypothetical protein